MQNSTIQQARGFTLIEIMIAVVIIGVLASIAYPSYQEHIRSTRRAAATACLLEWAQMMERHRTSTSSYLNPPSTANLNCANNNASGRFYQFVFADNQPQNNTYILLARPRADQSQANDRCGTLGIDHLGQRSLIGSASGVTVTDCWRQ